MPRTSQATGKSGPLMCSIRLGQVDVGVVDHRADAVDDFAEVVRCEVRGHADGDAGAAVDEEVRERGGRTEGSWSVPS